MPDLSHQTAQHVLVPGETAFAYLADPAALGRWSLGCFDTRPHDGDLYEGTSLFDGSRGLFRVDPDRARMTVDYWIGPAEALVPRISARVVDGPAGGYLADTCLVLLQAWRPHAMPEPRWRRLCAAHEAEIWLIKAQLESGWSRT